MTGAGNSPTQLTSGSAQFDQLRTALALDPAFCREVERAMHVNVNRVNPSDRGNRFITGGAVEWILAAAAWHVGVLTIPAGHSANGFDLVDLQEAARGLWSVKSQSSDRKGEFRMSNGLGGGGTGFADATIFVSPRLPGLVYANPDLHPDVKAAERIKKDAVTIPFRVISGHADQFPECVAVVEAPKNEGRGRENPFLAYTQTIITSEQFPLLHEMFAAASPPRNSVSAEVQKLAEQLGAGLISQAQFDTLIQAVASR